MVGIRFPSGVLVEYPHAESYLYDVCGYLVLLDDEGEVLVRAPNICAIELKSPLALVANQFDNRI